jgi:hypothetical protein
MSTGLIVKGDDEGERSTTTGLTSSMRSCMPPES